MRFRFELITLFTDFFLLSGNGLNLIGAPISLLVRDLVRDLIENVVDLVESIQELVEIAVADFEVFSRKAICIKSSR